MSTYPIDGGRDDHETLSAISRRRNASETDRRIAALADRARAQHADPTIRVTRVAPWSMKERP